MNKITGLPVFFIAILLVLNSCLYNTQTSPISRVLGAYKTSLVEIGKESKELVSMIENRAGRQLLHKQFYKARSAFKKVEWLAEYYYPYTVKKINGPALPEVEADEKNIIIQPEGFQVIEEILFDSSFNETDQPLLLQQAKILCSNISRLGYLFSIQETTDANIFDALRLELFRVIALGLTGFDSPVANNSIAEAATSVESIEQCLGFYQERIREHHSRLYDSLLVNFKEAKDCLSNAKDFASFDRMNFIRKILNPISNNLSLIQTELQIPFFNEPRPLKADAKTLFSAGIFNPDYYTPNIQSYSTPDKITLGKKLFYDGILSSDGKRSCATCHQPVNAFTDGIKTSKGLHTQTPLTRNAPTLINAALQPSQFYDLRVTYLEDQAKDVVSNQNEMHGSFENALKYISNNKEYKQLLRQVYKDEKPSDLHIRNAIAAYVRSLIALNSRFDQYMRGTGTALNKKETDGFNLFAGKARCATCHFLPLLNGANPPYFTKVDAEVIGVPASTDSLNPVLDTDKGKYFLYKTELHRNSFKTPTIRNIELTAPYMHNGVFESLEEVVDFYNSGGGKGLGLELQNQTLPADKLNLTAIEKSSLIAFMKTLTDTVVNRSH